MKAKEWNRRIPLDLSGIKLLGAALQILACERKFTQSKIERSLRNDEELSDPLGDFPGCSRNPEHYKQKKEKWETKRAEIAYRLNKIGICYEDYKNASLLRTNDFRFRWDHLRDHPVLIEYLLDEKPPIDLKSDPDVRICKHWDIEVVNALLDIFNAEHDRLTDPNSESVPKIQTTGDRWFYLTVWKLCEPDRGKGQPKGRRWNDGSKLAAGRAKYYKIIAEEAGNPISNSAAIDRSLEYFEVVTSLEFKKVLNKNSVVVSDAGGNDEERHDGAVKVIRKLLADLDKEFEKHVLG